MRATITYGGGCAVLQPVRATTPKVSPCRYSIAMNHVLRSSPKSKTEQRLGWSSCDASLASSRNMFTKRVLVAMWGWIVFTAIHFSKPAEPLSCARYTEAMPPCAIRKRSV